MSNDINLTASVSLIAKPDSGGTVSGPSCGPFPFNFSEIDVQEPFVTGIEVLPGDTFGGDEKVIDIPTHLRGVVGSGVQVFMLVRTDLPVKVRVRDVATAPVEFERTLGVGGSVMIAGGDPDIDRLSFEGIGTSTPRASISVWLITR